MLEIIGRTGNKIELISEEHQATVQRINIGTALWTILNEATLSRNLRSSLANLRQTTTWASHLVTDIHTIIGVGVIVADTSIAYNLKEAVFKIHAASDKRNGCCIIFDIDSGRGTMHALLKDPVLAMRLDFSLTNIEQSSVAFQGIFQKKERRSKRMGWV